MLGSYRYELLGRRIAKTTQRQRPDEQRALRVGGLPAAAGAAR